MQRFFQKESPVMFPLATENNKSSTSHRNVPNMCRCSSGVTTDLHFSVEYSVSPLLLVQLFYFYTFQQQNQTEALWSAASRRCSSACVNWSQSLRASVRRLQSVGRLVAMTAKAADDSVSECINNAKSYLHSAKKLKMGLFSAKVTSPTDVQLLAAQTSSGNDSHWKIWFSELHVVCLCVLLFKMHIVVQQPFFFISSSFLIWLFEYRKLCGWLELMKSFPLNSGCHFLFCILFVKYE